MGVRYIKGNFNFKDKDYKTQSASFLTETTQSLNINPFVGLFRPSYTVNNKSLVEPAFSIPSCLSFPVFSIR